MTKQMLFLDPPSHTRLRSLASQAFTPKRVEQLGDQIIAKIKMIAKTLLHDAESGQSIDIVSDLAGPLPAMVTAALLGVDVADHRKLKTWSCAFAEVLGNFQHNPERAFTLLTNLEEMTEYFRDAVRTHGERDGLIRNLLRAQENGDRLTEDEVIANVIVTMVGGQETTTNLIANGLLTLLRHPDQMARLRSNRQLLPSAVEEMLRFEPPSQHTARIAPSYLTLEGQTIQRGQAVIAVMAAANRDPLRFPDPDRFDISRSDNRHLSFGWGPHFCFGAALARLEARITFQVLLDRYEHIELLPGPYIWRENLGLRGLFKLPVTVTL